MTEQKHTPEQREREAFDAWSENFPRGKHTLWEAWKARAEISATEIATLRARVAGLESADENANILIEQLRQQRDDLRYMVNEDGVQLKALLREIDSLRQQRDELAEVLRKAVNDYGRPGGPWNVPSEPGAWIAMAKEQLAKVKP